MYVFLALCFVTWIPHFLRDVAAVNSPILSWHLVGGENGPRYVVQDEWILDFDRNLKHWLEFRGWPLAILSVSANVISVGRELSVSLSILVSALQVCKRLWLFQLLRLCRMLSCEKIMTW